jgi:hypothetical protein
MSTEYQDAVLADSPAVYLRLDETGTDTDGATWPDSSGNGLDGTQVYSGGGDVARGYTSPIETDGSSREFFGWSNPNPPLTGTSQIYVPNDSLIQPSNDFTVEAWIRPYYGMYAAVDIGLVSKVGSCGIQYAFSGGYERFAGFVIDSAGTRWRAIDTSFDFTNYIGTSFYIVVTRLGNTLTFWVNAKLRATTVITSGLSTKVTTNSFFVHHEGASHFAGARYDEAALYTHALTPTRIQAHYDAARLVLPLRSRLSIRSTLTLAANQETPVDFPFDHNFAQPFGDGQIPIAERLSYFTDVIPSRTDYEQRITLRSHGPSRTLHYQVTPSSPRARAILNAVLYKPAQLYNVPISSDRTPLTADAITGESTILLDTVGRDFEPGSQLRLGTWDNNETCVIDTVSDTEIGIVGTLANDWPTGTSVRPVRKARLIQNKIRSHLADHETDSMDFQIVSSELSTTRASAFTPALTYRDEEIFSLEKVRVDFLDEISIEDFRRVNTLDNKTGAFEQFSGDTGTARSIPVRLLYSDRSGMADFFGWLDVRMGQSTPLWIPSYENDLQAVSKSGSTLTIDSIGYTQRYNLHSARRDVCFILNDTTFTCRRITATVDNGNGTETLTFDGAVPTLADVKRISWLKYARLQGDEIEIEWHRASASGRSLLETTIMFRELLSSP